MRRLAPYAVVAVLAASAASLLSAQQQPAGPAAPKWEYLMVGEDGGPAGPRGGTPEAVAGAAQQSVSALGREGWEYAGPFGEEWYLFKRPQR